MLIVQRKEKLAYYEHNDRSVLHAIYSYCFKRNIGIGVPNA